MKKMKDYCSNLHDLLIFMYYLYIYIYIEVVWSCDFIGSGWEDFGNPVGKILRIRGISQPFWLTHKASCVHKLWVDCTTIAICQFLFKGFPISFQRIFQFPWISIHPEQPIGGCRCGWCRTAVWAGGWTRGSWGGLKFAWVNVPTSHAIHYPTWRWTCASWYLGCSWFCRTWGCYRMGIFKP